MSTNHYTRLGRVVLMPFGLQKRGFVTVLLVLIFGMCSCGVSKNASNNCKTTEYVNQISSHDVVEILFAENMKQEEITDIYLSTRAFQNWVIQLKKTTNYKGPYFSEEFTNHKKYPKNIIIDTLDEKSKLFLTDKFKNEMNLYKLDFENALQYSKGSYLISFVDKKTTQTSTTHEISTFPNNPPILLKNKYLLVSTENKAHSQIYYLSRWFYSYSYSIQKIWQKFFDYKIIHHSEHIDWEPEGLSYKQRKKLNLPLYLNLGLERDSLYYNYFHLILESDYRPESFQLVKQKKEKVIFRFYSKEDERYYKLEFNALRPYNFKIIKD